MTTMKLWPIVGLAALAGILAAAAWLYTPDASRRELEQKYRVTSRDYLAATGMRLHLLDTGSRTGPAVILLHGFGSSLQTFDAWAAALGADYRVVRYDLPGFGLTGPDPTGDYSDRRDMAVLEAVMDELGIARATLIGNSMGGKLAWRFAAARPERVERLVLVSPDGFASAGFAYGKAPRVPMLARVLPYVLPKMMVRMSLAPAYADPTKLTDDVVDRYSDMLRAPGVRAAILARTAQTVLEEPEPLLRNIRAPTLLLWGDRDAMIPIGNAADYLATIPQSRLAVLPGLGHVPFEEAPDASLQPVRAFLTQ